MDYSLDGKILEVRDDKYVQRVYYDGNRAEGIKAIPLTVKVVDRLTEPARFDAEQAYSPAWRAETPSMLRVLKCLLILVTVIPVSFDVSIGTPSNDHDMSIGISPFRIEQGTDTESPQLAISVLKAIGRSCGATKGHHQIKDHASLPKKGAATS
ncbi:hypothetical protein PUN28_006082 [Cardiocondyla obscurior]|uniref:Uncharacterized protein n=1 Tax=Cardiocondyla obscurior TaxID=286306 RepID=A0AAW2GC49_9HYME